MDFDGIFFFDTVQPGPGKMDSKLQAAVQELLEAYQELILEEPS